MRFYDFHIQGRNYASDRNLILEAKRLGYSGVSLVYPTKDDFNESKEYLSEIEKEVNTEFTAEEVINEIGSDSESPNISLNSEKIDYGNNGKNKFTNYTKYEDFSWDNFKIIPGIKIFPKNSEDLKKQIKTSRKKTNVLIAVGGDLKINRAACENIKLDILSRPYYKRRDCGINHVLAKEAARNNVAIELNICDVLRARSHLRSKIIAQFQEIIKLQRKFNFPLIISSGAVSLFDMRTPQDLIAFSQCFGLKKEEATYSISNTPKNIVKFNLNRKNVIAIGAEKVID